MLCYTTDVHPGVLIYRSLGFSTHAYIHSSRIRIHTYTRTHTHTYTHIHTYRYIYTPPGGGSVLLSPPCRARTDCAIRYALYGLLDRRLSRSLSLSFSVPLLRRRVRPTKEGDSARPRFAATRLDCPTPILVKLLPAVCPALT